MDKNGEVMVSALDLSNLGSNQEKLGDLLKEEKGKAIDEVMYKVANYNGATQDPYPSPFLSLSDTKIPKTTGEIFRWCKYFYTFDPLIAGAINALSAFPVTEVFLEEMVTGDSEDREDSDTLRAYKRVFYKNINIHKLLIEIGIDYFLYGNCFIFGEMHTDPISGSIEWKTMIRLDPSKIIIDYNAITQEKKYKWQVPNSIVRIVHSGQPVAEYNKIPEVIRNAIKKHSAIILNPKNIFHFPRPTDSMGDNSIWGTPVIANVLKLLMYRNTLRQAQEAIAREHIVPMRVYFLQKTDGFNPNANWDAVASALAGELMKSVRDPNHKVVSPVPIGVINVGGEGKSLLLTAEIEQVQSEILAGMNVPREFIFGGLSYSGSSVSLKILENHFITYRLLLNDFMQSFIIKNMAKARKEWVSEKDDAGLVRAKLMDLKMQDDVQQKNLVIQLNSSGKIPNEYMWKTLGMDPEKIKSSLKREAMENLKLETELKLAQMDSELKLQMKQLEVQTLLEKRRMDLMQQTGVDTQGGQPPIPGQEPTQQPGQEPTQPEPTQEPTQPGQEVVKGKGKDKVADNIKKTALRLLNVGDAERESFLSTLPEEMKTKLIDIMKEIKNIDNKSNKVDMRPMPEQKPPQRQSLKS